MHNGPLLLWTLFLTCILLLMTASAARMEVLNLDRSSEEEEKENSKDGTSALMAMAIGQALVEQGPAAAANQPVDGSESLVQVGESQGRRGAMAGCISQGGSGCDTAFTIAPGNRAGNSERALAEAAATVTRKAGEGDLAEIESSTKEETTKLASSATEKAVKAEIKATGKGSTTTQIQTTATTKNIALCDGDQGGSLPCSRVKSRAKDEGRHKPSECPDDLSKGKFFVQEGGHRLQGKCFSLSHKSAVLRKPWVTRKFPGLEGKYVVLTKPSIDHPHKSHENVVGFFLKRMVCTVDSPITCHTHKVGICAKCHDVAFNGPLNGFKDAAWPHDLTDKTALAKKFVGCLLKKAYDECEGEDLEYFHYARSIL